MKSEEFRSHLTQVEREAWDCFVAVARGLLGNSKADNYKELAKNMVEALIGSKDPLSNNEVFR